MINEKIKAHVIEYCKAKGWGTTDEDVFETIREVGKQLYQEKAGSHRWYDDLFVVVEFNGMMIGYDDFYMTGDNNASDMGLDYDEDSICEVEAVEKVVTVYQKKA